MHTFGLLHHHAIGGEGFEHNVQVLKVLLKIFGCDHDNIYKTKTLGMSPRILSISR